MASTAAHLVDRVLPDERLRQWGVTFPQPLPRLLAWRPDLLGLVLADLSAVLQEHLRTATGRPDGRTDSLTAVKPPHALAMAHRTGTSPTR